MKRSSLVEQPCPVGRAAGQLLDAWTFVILRELFLGQRRFEALRQRTGMSPRSLSLRLNRLQEQQILEKHALDEAPGTHEYRLTEKGLELWPVLMTLRQWGERWTGPWGRRGMPFRLMHRGHGHVLNTRLVCVECGEPVHARSGEVAAK